PMDPLPWDDETLGSTIASQLHSEIQSMRIALAQLSASPDREANLAKILGSMTSARERGAELIAFPEVILDRFFPQVPGDKAALDLAEPIPGPVADRIAGQARELGLVTVFNMYEVDSQ